MPYRAFLPAYIAADQDMHYAAITLLSDLCDCYESIPCDTPHSEGTSVLQVLKYVSEACDSCLEREPLCREPAELLLLWKVVQLLCQHKGDLHSALTPGVNDKRPGKICLSSSLLSPQALHSSNLLGSG